MPDVVFRKYRRFYAKCPFGPARGDMQAWLGAAMTRQQKLPDINESILWWGKRKRQRVERTKPRGNVGRRWVEQMEAAGKKVIRLKPGELPPVME